jgi:predicted DNA-binding protein with PD1-like motif
MIAETIRASGVGLDGASFVAAPDPETNFTLFGPVPDSAGAPAAEGHFFALRLRPNQDLALALEGFCRERGLGGGVLHGGVGSIIGARFTDGRTIEPFATEMAIRAGRIEAGPNGELAAHVDVALVDLTGAVSEGSLVRGDNPILMTLEVVLEPF